MNRNAPGCITDTIKLLTAYWTTQRYGNSWIAKSRTSQLTDWSTCGSYYMLTTLTSIINLMCIQGRQAKYDLQQENSHHRMFVSRSTQQLATSRSWTVYEL